MAISWLGKTSAVRQFVAAVQSAANAAVDASQGSFTLALGQAATGAFLWLQALVVSVLKLTRAATSFGADLDSWMADWFFERLPAVTAAGQVTVSRATATLQATVAPGQLFSAGIGGPRFIVTTDAGHSNWNAGLNAYVLAPATASINVPVSAVDAGIIGNVLAATITSFVTPISGVDTVTNAADFNNGVDAESDPSFKSRFRDYIGALVRGTPLALRFAVLSTRQGLTCTIIENKDVSLATDLGFVTLVVDDGTGDPAQSIIDAAALAVDSYRAAGIRFSVIKPDITNVTIALTVVSQDTGLHSADTAAAQAAILTYVNSLPVGAKLVWARLYQIAFDAAANIVDVSNILVNGATADITVTAKGIIKTSSVSVS